MVEEIIPVKGKLKINNIFILHEIYYWDTFRGTELSRSIVYFTLIVRLNLDLVHRRYPGGRMWLAAPADGTGLDG